MSDSPRRRAFRRLVGADRRPLEELPPSGDYPLSRRVLAGLLGVRLTGRSHQVPSAPDGSYDDSTAASNRAIRSVRRAADLDAHATAAGIVQTQHTARRRVENETLPTVVGGLAVMVRKSDLGALEETGSNGFDQMYRVPEYLLPGDASPVAYLQFTTAQAIRAQAAIGAITFRHRLAAADRAELDRRTVWPRALVEDGGSVVGLLMPVIPDEFFIALVDPATGTATRTLRTLRWMIASPEQRAAAGMIEELDDVERLILLGQLVYGVALLHKYGWVYGDLSFASAAFTTNPPQLILLDGDQAAPLSDLARRQAHTPFWQPPESSLLRLQGKETDVYKLGLAILRGLRPGRGVASTRDPQHVGDLLDPAGEALVAAAVDPDPTKRPTAKELYAYLRGVVETRVKPPEVLAARLTPIGAAGTGWQVEWQVRNATEVTIVAGADQPQTVLATGQLQAHTIPPTARGVLVLLAVNRFGSLAVELGDLGSPSRGMGRTGRRRSRPPVINDEVAMRIVELRQQGLSYEAIANTLNAERAGTPLVSVWTKAHVDRVLHTQYARNRIDTGP
jgi:hypothetical protein